MNKRRLTSFRNWFAKQDPDEYDQWSCEKCVWGHARVWARTRRTPINLVNSFGKGSESTFAAVFGLSYTTSADVFIPDLSFSDHACIRPTKGDALYMLDNLITTGNVQWPAKYGFRPRVEGRCCV